MSSWGFHEHRRKRQRAARTIKLLLVVAAAAGSLGAAYTFGHHVGGLGQAQLETQRDAAIARGHHLEGERAALATELAETRAKLRAVEERYAQAVPTGERRDLLEQIVAKLAAGVTAERLATVIAAAENERACEQPATKRFLVRTPVSPPSGGDASSFADGQIVVTGLGISAKDESQNPEAWFDPNQPVTLRFAALGGAASEAKGKLPLHHSVVLGGWEYRFSAMPSTRGYVAVTADRCKYP
jgi:hypothetical protein